MDGCLSRIIVQSIKDELGHWDDPKEEQCGSEFAYLSGEEEVLGGYPDPAAGDGVYPGRVYPGEGCGSFSTSAHDNVLTLNGVVKREWDDESPANHVEERPHEMVSFPKGFGGFVPHPPVVPGCWPVATALTGQGCHNATEAQGCHNADPLAFEYIELKPKVRDAMLQHCKIEEDADDEAATLQRCDDATDDPRLPGNPDHRPELAYVLVERLPVRVLEAWLPSPPVDPLAAVGGKRRHSSLSLQLKMEILRDVENAQLAKKEIAVKYQIPQSTLSTLIRNRARIEDCRALGVTGGRYRSRGAKHKRVEAVLFEYVQQARKKNVAVGGQALQREAGRIAARLGIEDFAASSGWLWRFQRRYNIAPQPAVVEDPSPRPPDVADEQWLSSLCHIVSDHPPRDVFTLSELGLFYDSTPDRTPSLRRNKCTNGERRGHRLTVSLGFNADASERLDPLAIGCARRCDHPLPCAYRHSDRAWMTRDIFAERVRSLQSRAASTGRNVLLVSDEPSLRGLDHGLYPNVRLLALPTGAAGPGRGAAKAFRRAYRLRMLRHYLAEMRRGSPLGKWDLSEALGCVSDSWRSLSENTLRQCWAEARLASPTGEDAPAEENLDPAELRELGVPDFDRFAMVDDGVSTRQPDPAPPDPGTEQGPAPSIEEVNAAVLTLDRMAATYSLPAKVSRAVRVLNKYAADISRPSPREVPPREALLRETLMRETLRREVLLRESPPMQSPPMQSPPIQSAPVRSPPMQSPPIQSPPMQSPPMQLPPMQSPPKQSAPVRSPPVRSPPMQSPPIQSHLVKSPPIQSSPIESPPNGDASHLCNGWSNMVNGY